MRVRVGCIWEIGKREGSRHCGGRVLFIGSKGWQSSRPGPGPGPCTLLPSPRSTFSLFLFALLLAHLPPFQALSPTRVISIEISRTSGSSQAPDGFWLRVGCEGRLGYARDVCLLSESIQSSVILGLHQKNSSETKGYFAAGALCFRAKRRRVLISDREEVLSAWQLFSSFFHHPALTCTLLQRSRYMRIQCGFREITGPNRTV
ncbi:hypothetical protein BZA05DRAFT_73587 [Tricharina praecox]|uniref:uncharacterized protein n=1 Tax=Tricharina praecox TaxID=43433 RepID=UPI00221EC4BB|nr:uncharacterized protein BZA05DRAFT_73587 [Tricharina praecox]KAI5849696.1 hypothetical protein BZA05DRAFT_73587 [Tricharina praecox]